MNKRITKKKLNQLKKETIKGMELGNLIFGNSRGTYHINRDWQSDFISFLRKCGLDSYGYAYDGDMDYNGTNTARGGFENDIFRVTPYYWGDDEKIEEEPNFIYKPTGYTISWYKYALRDSYSNKSITKKSLDNILQKCVDSLNVDKIKMEQTTKGGDY